MFATLLRKEFLEQKRTSKLLIVMAVFFIAGLISPVLAKYTPVILRSIPDMPAGLAGIIPDPTVKDAIGQYIKNVSQFGILLAVLFTMGSIAQEKERGTAAMLLAKPVRRSAVICSKWVVGMAVLAASLGIAAVACYAYTAILFAPISIGKFLLLNFFLLINLGVYLTLALLASTLARSQGMAALGAFGGLVLLLIAGSIPRLGEIMPGQLLNWGAAILFATTAHAWPALVVSFALIVLMLLLAIYKFQKEEI